MIGDLGNLRTSQMNTMRQFTSFTDIEAEQSQWLWPDRIATRAITLLEGDPGQAKSAVTYDLAARVSTGAPMPNCESAMPAAGVVLLQNEDSPGNTVKPRLIAAGADLSRILAYDKKQFADQPIHFPDDIALIEDVVAEHKVSLIVVDPFFDFLRGDPNSGQNVRKVLLPLSDLAERRNLAVLLVRHLTKHDSGNALYRGSGSIGIVGAARSALLAAQDPCSDDPHRHILALSKTNLSSAASLAYRTVLQDGAVVVQWLGTSAITAQDLSGSGGHEHSALYEAMEFLCLILTEAGGSLAAMTVHQLAREATISVRTLQRAKVKLRVKSKRYETKFGYYWAWDLPKDDAFLAPFKEMFIIGQSTAQGEGGNEVPAAG
jgi:hypothetical protein